MLWFIHTEIATAGYKTDNMKRTTLGHLSTSRQGLLNVTSSARTSGKLRLDFEVVRIV